MMYMSEHLSRREVFSKSLEVAVGAGAFVLNQGTLSKIAEAAERVIGSPFEEYAQERVYAEVLAIMHVPKEKAPPLPNVRRADEAADVVYDELAGFAVHGKRWNVFVRPDLIYLTSDAALHNLAHEMVHYLQYRLDGVTLDDMRRFPDLYEDEAVDVQNDVRGGS
jgi:hypothetical protein